MKQCRDLKLYLKSKNSSWGTKERDPSNEILSLNKTLLINFNCDIVNFLTNCKIEIKQIE